MSEPTTYRQMWGEVDGWAKKSKEEFSQAEAALKAIGFHHLGVSSRGVWEAKHKDHGWLSSPTSAGLLAKAQASVKAAAEKAAKAGKP